MPEQALTSQQRALVDTWERHTDAEFGDKSIEASMTGDPVVNHVPVMTGDVGVQEVRHFYNGEASTSGSRLMTNGHASSWRTSKEKVECCIPR